MSFDVSQALKKSTGRAKSDVANKLVSMFLHEVSRKASLAAGMTVSEPMYAQRVREFFGDKCLYCRTSLEKDRTAVEHLEGMNRVRVGLHIPGNVAISCKNCNNEKRRDDQKRNSNLAETGWESFLMHTSEACLQDCKSCKYWRARWPESKERIENLTASRIRIDEFRSEFQLITDWSVNTQRVLCEEVEKLYRNCQDFATNEISELSSKAGLNYSILIAGK